MSSTQDSGNGYAKAFDLRDRLAAQAAGIPKTVDDTQEVCNPFAMSFSLLRLTTYSTGH